MKTLAKTSCFVLFTSLFGVCFAQNTQTPLLTDANGRIIGRLDSAPKGIGDVGTVILNAANENLILGITSAENSTGLTWSWRQVFYTAPGCAGPAYLIGGAPGTRRTGVASKQGSQWSVFVSFKNPTFFTSGTFASSTTYTGECWNFGQPIGQSGLFTQVEYILSLDKLGSPPFYIK